MKWLRKLLSRKIAVSDDGCQIQYAAVINEKWQWFNSKEEMFDFISEYAKVNTIYKVAMFRNEMYNLKPEN